MFGGGFKRLVGLVRWLVGKEEEEGGGECGREEGGVGFEGCKKRRSPPIKRTRMQLLPHTLAKALKGRQRDMNLKTKSITFDCSNCVL